ncbi:MAG TPA: LamG-like jellyroll fold domain-containing protein, partial [Pyrinomonadaceae bacterium]
MLANSYFGSYNIITRITVTGLDVARIRALLALVIAAASVFGCAAPSARAQGLPGSLPNTSCAPQPAGAVAWFPGEGTAEDVQGGNHGTPQNGAYFTKGGRVGSAFLFDGVDDFVSVPASPSLNVGAGAGLTVEMWIKPSDPNGWQPLVEWNNGGAFGVHFWMNVGWNGNGPGSLFGNLVDTNGTYHHFATPVILTANVYQHVALTYDRNSGVARIF